MSTKCTYVIFLFNLFLTGCHTQLGISGQAREDLIKSIKAYGEHWTKPGMTKESWRKDWVACGGRSNGQYSTNAPPNSDIKVLMNSVRRAEKELGSCMRDKGYVYQP